VTRRGERCSATRRDGQPCQAPTIPGGFVCRVHGGSASQVQIAAGLRLREDALLRAQLAWQESRSFTDLCQITEAERDLDEYRAKLELLARLRRQLRQQRGTPPLPLPSGTLTAPSGARPKPPTRVTVCYGRGRRAGPVRPARHLSALRLGPRTLPVHGRVGVLRPPGLPEPALPQAAARSRSHQLLSRCMPAVRRRFADRV